jgi:glycosyltransferase involved in cell wall biosynthesis
MYTLTVVIPCFNEESTLETCVQRVRKIADKHLSLEIVIVVDASTDGSLTVARKLAGKHNEIIVLHHDENRGKGAALRTGFAKATGDFVAVQDADLEYDPQDLKRLLIPLIDGRADVVLGSRFLATGPHRVLYFWHYLGNKFLTFLSNMFTDLNLTDMETCYKVFKHEVIQSVNIKENRFGFEPEIVAKISRMRLRIYEMGISYHGRTYEEGKKITARDGWRALYCILRYNASNAPVFLQFLIYLFIGGAAALVNLLIFLGLYKSGVQILIAAPVAFFIAAGVNYLLCLILLFRHKARWNSFWEAVIFLIVVIIIAGIDTGITQSLIAVSFTPGGSKLIATAVGLVFNFLARRYIVFPEKGRGPWKQSLNISIEDENK